MGASNLGGLDSYTSSLLHCDGSDTSTTFTDEVGNTFTAQGNAQIDTAQSVFGGASGLFDGIGDFLLASNNVTWNFGSGDFSADVRAMFHALPTAPAHFGLVAHYDSATSQREWLFCLNVSRGVYYLQFNYSINGTSVTACQSTWTPTLDTWYHLSVVRNGNSLIMRVGGTQVGSTFDMTGITLHTSTHSLTIGRGASDNDVMNGWLDEVRVSKGIARWTADFTPPSRAYNNYSDIGLRFKKASGTFIIPVQTVTSANKLRVYKGSTTYGIPLLATTDYYAGVLRINDGTTTKAIPEEAV